jgi:hypothetical protein
VTLRFCRSKYASKNKSTGKIGLPVMGMAQNHPQSVIAQETGDHAQTDNLGGSGDVDLVFSWRQRRVGTNDA